MESAMGNVRDVNASSAKLSSDRRRSMNWRSMSDNVVFSRLR
jgi:hypothetical protein